MILIVAIVAIRGVIRDIIQILDRREVFEFIQQILFHECTTRTTTKLTLTDKDGLTSALALTLFLFSCSTGNTKDYCQSK